MFFVRVKDMIVMYTPKCGCRTVLEIVGKLGVRNVIKKKQGIAEINKARDRDKLKVIFIIRNPYEKLISGFINKYCQHTKYLDASKGRRPNAKLNTFEEFVDTLLSDRKVIDKAHFLPQVSRDTNLIINNFKPVDKFYDIKKINEFVDDINQTYHTKISLEQISKNRTGNYVSDKINSDFECCKQAYLLTKDEILKLIKQNDLPSYKNFYNPEIKQKVRQIYQRDFDLFEKHGIFYDI